MHTQTRLFVGNLPEFTSEKDLNTAFSSYGQIVNLDLKSKSGDESNKKSFAFITLAAENQSVETCIKYFTQHEFKGQRLYVTRARESFLERLQRERDSTQKSEEVKTQELPKKNPIIKLSEKLNPRKRKSEVNDQNYKSNERQKAVQTLGDGGFVTKENHSQKKQDSDKKRMDSMKKKRQEFREKQMIIKTGLIGIDKVQNKKVIFDDDEENPKPQIVTSAKKNKDTGKRTDNKKNTLFDENDDSGDELNFEIKKQFEGKKGQKVLDLQSRYKSDKRFVLDGRFIEEDSDSEEEKNDGLGVENEAELNPEEEKAKQLDILQDVLGVSIKSRSTDTVNNNNKKVKSKLGMLRFDPTQPHHAKFLAPVEVQDTKKGKKKKKEIQDEPTPEEVEQPSVEVSKEQFYKVSETLKEAIAQPTTFSFRSLFGSNEEETKKEEEADYIPLETDAPKDKKKKVKNPFDPGEKNPFVYDSSDSEIEEKDETPAMEKIEPPTETKAVWMENLFFSDTDFRLKEGLAFFNKTSSDEIQKERRELKSLMKKRIYNKERKNQMFQKKIGGRKKTMKKTYRKNK